MIYPNVPHDKKALAAFRRWHKRHPGCKMAFMDTATAELIFGDYSGSTCLILDGVDIIVLPDGDLPGRIRFLPVFKTWFDLVTRACRERRITAAFEAMQKFVEKTS